MLASTSSQSRRVLESIAFIAVWMLFGLRFHLSANAYLLTGIPLTLLFQRYFRKQPISALWVKGSTQVRLNRAGWLLAAGLLIVPVFYLFRYVYSPLPHRGLLLLCDVLACFSVVPAAFAFQHFTEWTWRCLALCLATAGLIGVALFLLAFLAHHPTSMLKSHEFFKLGIQNFLWYLPWVFLVEEVTFRGLIDAHVHHETDAHRILSALFVSTLWGIWHYPVIPNRHLVQIPALIVSQCLVGVPLSFYWRKSGNLGVTSTVHAFVDAFRNALGLFHP